MPVPDPRYIERIVRSGLTVPRGMEALITYCEENCPSPVWREIRTLDLDADVAHLGRWLRQVLLTEPPSSEIEAYWFGLFNPLEDGVESCDLYVAGSDHFNPDDLSPEWAVNPSYFPGGRYAESRVLVDLHQGLALADENAFDFGDYTLCLGYACLAVAEICAAVGPTILLGPRTSRAVAVGFDSGDLVLLGVLDSSGLH
jgi:hypothetical protein